MVTIDSIGTYLIKRLYEHGVHHIFGVPGDYVLGFDKLLENSPIQFINTCDEQGEINGDICKAAETFRTTRMVALDSDRSNVLNLFSSIHGCAAHPASCLCV
ncbi:thiamine pyrophosphate-binding protein [Scytonema sp. NUACC26]|uniref:thiamine pyrophosphate-binding protein n=1 Tax=Scytonema sp. NUACC26 TaxID=3140176 RepID=UPI0038B2F996